MRNIMTLLAGFVVLALGATQALAAPITINGVTFGVGANLKTATIWQDSSAAPGNPLIGIGRVTAIDSPDCGGLCWVNAQNGVQLAFTFQYLVEKVTAITATVRQVLFSGGATNFYTIPAGSFATGPTQAAAIASVTSGTPWLNTIGGATGTSCDATCFGGAGAVVTLESLLNVSGSDLATVSSGFASGFLNVGAGSGAANAYFDTGSQPSGQDMQIATSFSTNTIGGAFPLSGSADIRSVAQNVPEPGSLILFGAGLLGWAGLTRYRQRS